MASIRELIVGALASANQTERIGIAPVDRARALADSAEWLAVAIKHLHAHSTPENLRKVIFLLDIELLESKETKWVAAINSVDRLILEYMAIEEWQQPRCTVCKGRAFVRAPDQPQINCTECGGSGWRRYGDDERRERYGRPLIDAEKRLMSATAGVLAHHDMLGDEATKDRLYRRVEATAG